MLKQEDVVIVVMRMRGVLMVSAQNMVVWTQIRLDILTLV
jgi:hypothetical protein